MWFRPPYTTYLWASSTCATKNCSKETLSHSYFSVHPAFRYHFNHTKISSSHQIKQLCLVNIGYPLDVCKQYNCSSKSSNSTKCVVPMLQLAKWQHTILWLWIQCMNFVTCHPLLFHYCCHLSHCQRQTVACAQTCTGETKACCTTIIIKCRSLPHSL